MVILAFDSSAKAASVALCRDEKLISQYYQATGLTHSRTLLPMAEDLLKNADMTLKDIDAVAVAHGPGSFTGVRIGVSAVKGLCWGLDIPAIGVSTLEAMAYNGECAPDGSVICCAMDARRNQVYNALFSFENGQLKRLSRDRAIGLDELGTELQEMKKQVFVVGDGAELCYNYLDKIGISAVLAPENVRNQTACGVCRAALGKEPVPARDIIPVYLRLSQAERERLQKLKEN